MNWGGCSLKYCSTTINYTFLKGSGSILDTNLLLYNYLIMGLNDIFLENKGKVIESKIRARILFFFKNHIEQFMIYSTQ